MARWAPAKKDTLGALADEIIHNYGKGRVIVGIDGPHGEATPAFADDLAQSLRERGATVFRSSITGFYRPRGERHAEGDDSPEGYYRDAFDYSALRRVLVEPFRMGGSTAFVPAVFDVARDAAVEPTWLSGPDDAILLIDGEFLNRPELRGIWNYSVWVDAPVGAIGEGRYGGAQMLYSAETGPRTRATAIIDVADPEHPRRIFADSC